MLFFPQSFRNRNAQLHLESYIGMRVFGYLANVYIRHSRLFLFRNSSYLTYLLEGGLGDLLISSLLVHHLLCASATPTYKIVAASSSHDMTSDAH